mmetsp:Transcript_30365/g.98495  ORF Transcript_30365/g.98495 Transcript_30365/m.98495 type:complete len:213 (-) Transcript_30365:20-658(-)
MRRNVRRLNREVNDGQPNHQHVGIVAKQARPSDSFQAPPKRGRSRKAANLAELQRYFTAAAEAASEVLHEDTSSDNREDLAKIAEVEIKPLDSPSRMVAVSLASGNLRFRDKLREKLEATGGVACKIHVGASIQKPESAPEANVMMQVDLSRRKKECVVDSGACAVDSGIKKRKRELRVTIDEADNFGLVLVRSSQSTLTEASSAPTPNNPR